VQVDTETELDKIAKLFNVKEHLLDDLQITFIIDVMSYKQSENYTKAIKLLESL
jgi:hypothetical protein